MSFENLPLSGESACGDDGIIRDFVNMIRGGETSISCTKLEDSIYGHLCVYKADEAMEKCVWKKLPRIANKPKDGKSKNPLRRKNFLSPQGAVLFLISYNG